MHPRKSSARLNTNNRRRLSLESRRRHPRLTVRAGDCRRNDGVRMPRERQANKPALQGSIRPIRIRGRPNSLQLLPALVKLREFLFRRGKVGLQLIGLCCVGAMEIR